MVDNLEDAAAGYRERFAAAMGTQFVDELARVSLWSSTSGHLLIVPICARIDHAPDVVNALRAAADQAEADWKLSRAQRS